MIFNDDFYASLKYSKAYQSDTIFIFNARRFISAPSISCSPGDIDGIPIRIKSAAVVFGIDDNYATQIVLRKRSEFTFNQCVSIGLLGIAHWCGLGWW